MYGQTAVGAFALGQGFVIDLLSGGLHGLFALLYLCVFGMILLGSQTLDLKGTKGQIIILFSVILTKQALLLVVLYLFDSQIGLGWPFLYSSIVSAGVTGLLAPVLFYMLERLRTTTLFEKQNGRSD